MQHSTAPPSPPARRAFRPLPTGLPGSPRANVFVLTVSIGIAFFLAVEPTLPWLLVLVAGLTALGMSAILRAEAPVRSDLMGQEYADAPDSAETAFSLIIPVLWVFGAGLLAEYVVDGYWSLAAAAAIAAGLATIVYSEIASLDSESAGYQQARFALNVAAYIIAFALFAAPYALDLERLPASIFIGVAAILMSIELMREAPMPSLQVFVVAMTTGILLIEARWVFYFLPLSPFLASTLLLLMFYLTTGLLQAQLLSKLTFAETTEYAMVGATGLLLIIGAHVLF